jgi:NAD-dependent dihydropyrimidine dehydrogenase PreA subunit
MVEVKINYSLCNKCKKCVETCAYGVLEWFEEQPVVTNPKNCTACLECTIKCPLEAVTVKK